MADEGDIAGAGGPSTGTDSLLDRVLPLFEHTHDTATTALVVVFAAILGMVAGWVAADFGARFLAFVVGAVGTGYLLYDQPTRRAILAAGLYSLAALLAVAPFLYELGLVLTVEAPLRHVLSPSDLVIFLVFWVVAAVPALVANRLAKGPFTSRFRRRLAG
jgi:hypothetical protein